MEGLIITSSKKKSALLKQILVGLGVTIQQEDHTSTSAYKKKIAKVSTWTEEDLKAFV
jgi:hypothetical protein